MSFLDIPLISDPTERAKGQKEAPHAIEHGQKGDDEKMDFYANLDPKTEFAYQLYLRENDRIVFLYLEKIQRKSAAESNKSCALRVLNLKGQGYIIFDLNGNYVAG